MDNGTNGRCHPIVVVCAMLIAALVPQQEAVAQGTSSAVRAWTVSYADGREVSTVLQPKGSVWTPKFPRITGAETSHDGRALYALELAYVVEGEEVDFTIALFYGGLQTRVVVGNMRVTLEHSVRVDALRAYGVEPIGLSLIVVPPTLTYSPAIVNASAWLEARVDPVAPHAPLYRFVLTNHSTRPLLAIQFALYRGNDVVLSGRRRDDRNEPLVRPGQEYTFDVPISRGNDELWIPIDRVEISSVVWDDGLVEGDQGVADKEQQFRKGRAASISYMLSLLRSANTFSISEFRARFATITLFDPVMTRIRDAALARLDQIVERKDRPAFRKWLTEQIAEYEAWLDRLTQ